MMKKLAILSMLVLFASFASAWHCADTDEPNPDGTPYGDNGQLGGITNGWLDSDLDIWDWWEEFWDGNGELPNGCRLSDDQWWPVICEDFCDGTTLTEFYCDQRHEPFGGERIITYKAYENACGENEVPEFGTLGAGLALVGASIVILRKRK